MAQVTPIEDLSDQSFYPYSADGATYGSIEDSYSILEEFRASDPVFETSLSRLIGMPARSASILLHTLFTTLKDPKGGTCNLFDRSLLR